jgi:hypothetical protein
MSTRLETIIDIEDITEEQLLELRQKCCEFIPEIINIACNWSENETLNKIQELYEAVDSTTSGIERSIIKREERISMLNAKQKSELEIDIKIVDESKKKKK